MPGLNEWLVIALVVLVLFGGASQIPRLMRTLGRAKGDFRKGQREVEDEEAEATVLRRARELGVPTDGRPVADIRRDIEAREPKTG